MNQLKLQNQRLLEQNQTLKQSLQDLIAVNTQLTESIEQYSNTNALNERIIELENQNKALKNQLNNTIRKIQSMQHDERPDLVKENQELTDIVRSLMEKSNMSQKIYDEEIEKLTKELEYQKRHAEDEIRKMQQRHSEQIMEYQQAIGQLKRKNQNLNASVELKVLKKSQLMQNQERERKSLKVSTTIEDLRHVLTTQIEEKDKIIHIYENLIQKLKEKIKQKF